LLDCPPLQVFLDGEAVARENEVGNEHGGQDVCAGDVKVKNVENELKGSVQSNEAHCGNGHSTRQNWVVEDTKGRKENHGQGECKSDHEGSKIDCFRGGSRLRGAQVGSKSHSSRINVIFHFVHGGE